MTTSTRRRGAAVATVGALAASLALSACGGSSGSGSGKTYTIKLATPTGVETPIGQAAKFWSETVEKESDGRIKVQLYDSGSLVPGSEILKATQDGRVNVGIVPNAYHPKELAALSVVATPYVTQKSPVDVAALNDLEKSNTTLSDEYDDLGLKALFYAPTAGAIAISKDPITSLADIKGLRFRALATTDTMVKPLGGSGSFVEFADIYESIQRGVLDGAFPNEIASGVGASLFEVAPYFTSTGVGTFTVSAGFISKKTWDSYPAGIKAAIDRTNEKYDAWLPEAFGEFETRLCDKLLEGGGKPSILPQDQIDAWREKVEEPLNAFLVKTAEAGGISAADFEALQDDYRTAAAKYENATDYEDGMVACAARAG